MARCLALRAWSTSAVSLGTVIATLLLRAVVQRFGTDDRPNARRRVRFASPLPLGFRVRKDRPRD